MNIFFTIYSSPSVSMLQGTRTVSPGIIESNQYLPLTACPPSLALIYLHVSAGNSGIEPIGTVGEQCQCFFQQGPGIRFLSFNFFSPTELV